MIFTESFPLIYSLGLIIAISTFIFFWRFYIFRKKLILNISSIPSIVVLGVKGSGKTSFIKSLAGYVEVHPIQDGFNVANLSLGEKKLQLIEVPYFADGIPNHLQEIKNMKLIGAIYVFDVSKDSEPIENQLENFKRFKEFFREVKFFALANKMDIADEQKIEKLKSEIDGIYTVSFSDTFQAKKELNDVLALIRNLSSEISQPAEIKV